MVRHILYWHHWQFKSVDQELTNYWFRIIEVAETIFRVMVVAAPKIAISAKLYIQTESCLFLDSSNCSNYSRQLLQLLNYPTSDNRSKLILYTYQPVRMLYSIQIQHAISKSDTSPRSLIDTVHRRPKSCLMIKLFRFLWIQFLHIDIGKKAQEKLLLILI